MEWSNEGEDKMIVQPKEEVAKSSQQASRVGKKVISGYFEPAVAKALKKLALDFDTTLLGIMSLAFNDLLEKNGHGRPADESMVPPGGSSHKR